MLAQCDHPPRSYVDSEVNDRPTHGLTRSADCEVENEVINDH